MTGNIRHEAGKRNDAPRDTVERETQGEIMVKTSSVVLTAVLLCSGFPATGQQLPDGPGKELAQANCNICHPLLSRVGSGYTANGWNTVLRMMVNQDRKSTRLNSSHT